MESVTFRWVGEQFARVGANADPAACRALLAVVGDNPAALATEIEKPASWAAQSRSTNRRWRWARRSQGTAVPLTDAWGSRDLTALLASCERTLERSGDRPPRVVPRLVGILASYVARVLDCQVLAAEGVTVRDAAGPLGPAPLRGREVIPARRKLRARMSSRTRSCA